MNTTVCDEGKTNVEKEFLNVEKEFLNVDKEFLNVGEEFSCGYLRKTIGFFVKTIGFFVFPCGYPLIFRGFFRRNWGSVEAGFTCFVRTFSISVSPWGYGRFAPFTPGYFVPSLQGSFDSGPVFGLTTEKEYKSRLP